MRYAVLVLVSVLALGCQRSSPTSELAWHGKVEIKSPIQKVEQACGQARCALEHPTLDSIEYGADASGRIKAVLVRYKLPRERSVQASRNLFTVAREDLKRALGEGATFLDSGDPTYWPARDSKERVVTITVDNEERPVIAIGVIGPGAEKIPVGGAAHDLGQVQQYWSKIASALLEANKAPQKEAP